jgi:acetyl esterase
VCGTLLLYPVTDHYSAEPPSYTEHAAGQTLTRKLMVWFWDTYLGERSADDPQAAAARPLRSDALHTLPPCLIITAERDPLRDEGIAFAERVAAAGVALVHHHYPDAEHGFACGMGMTPELRQLFAQINDWLHSGPVQQAQAAA